MKRPNVAPPLEVDQQIDVAVGPRLVAGGRPEQRE